MHEVMTAPPPPPPLPSRFMRRRSTAVDAPPQRLLAITCLSVFCGILLFNFVSMCRFAAVLLGYPYDYDYGEGIVWQQMLNIVAGHGYSPIGVYPAIVYHYPPVYHLTVAATAALTGLDQLVAGRLVSFVSALFAMPLAGMLAASCVARNEPRVVRWAVGAIAGLCLASTVEIVTWAVTMRVDLLATALGLGGMVLAIRAVERPAVAIGAALLFTLAIYTKQTSIAAPAAALAMLWVARPGAALTLLAACVTLGVAILAVLTVATDGGFLRHILVYNINRMAPGHVIIFAKFGMHEIGWIVAGMIGAIQLWRRLAPARWRTLRTRLREDRTLCAGLMILIFLALTAAMLPMVLKSGASSNYLIQWVCALSILSGVACLAALRLAVGLKGKFGLLIAIGLPIQAFVMPNVVPSSQAVAAKTADMNRIVARIRASPKPVITDDMILLIRAGRPVLWEPSIAAELGGAGRYDERAFARLVRSGAFGFFFTQGDRGTLPFDERYNPVVADAMDAAYPVRIVIDGDVLHLPRR